MTKEHGKAEVLRERRKALLRQMDRIGDLRPGSLVEMYRKCGKPNCRCARPGERGHGPTFILTRKKGGKTVTRAIPDDAVQRTREQLAEYRRFQEVVREFVEVSEAICDAELRERGPGGRIAGKDVASRRPSPRRSTPEGPRRAETPPRS
ncbi:MAG TPA: hypothetical protein PLQ97_14650 [Myxococcota bacterium]|mgnify:CR=1 FL=1|nr:hypothetical protein [Myxococcota bacterium]HQK51921.1 hypothetical protein [Myxococcota bacterium]